MLPFYLELLVRFLLCKYELRVNNTHSVSDIIIVNVK